MTKRRAAADCLPLTPAMFEVLIALADGEKHGYAVLKEVARRSDGQVTLSPGTLYAIIRRFVSDGIVAESDERPDAALDDERRRYYRLTNAGRQCAVAEAQRLADLVSVARAKRLLPGEPQAASGGAQ